MPQRLVLATRRAGVTFARLGRLGRDEIHPPSFYLATLSGPACTCPLWLRTGGEQNFRSLAVASAGMKRSYTIQNLFFLG